jgi:ATP-dependent DNA helicase RecG
LRTCVARDGRERGSIDEQHRFGVEQRLALARKGHAVDMLVMTATPIPRTLALAFFGDMDISELRDKPAGRKPIATRAVPLDRLFRGDRRRRPGAGAESARILGVPAGRGQYHRRSRGGAGSLRSAAGELRTRPVGLVAHGRMKGADKDAVMARFAAGETRLLVATTVIELGVDVSDASVMVIMRRGPPRSAACHRGGSPITRK